MYSPSKKIVPNPLLPHTVNKTKVGLLSRISLALPYKTSIQQETVSTLNFAIDL